MRINLNQVSFPKGNLQDEVEEEHSDEVEGILVADHHVLPP